ncbi:MAG: hypothetical protein AAGG56_04985 [Pseudomonadota bacterium]
MHVNEQFRATGLTRYLPTVLGVIIVLAIGYGVDLKVQKLSCHTQREYAAEYLGSLKKQVEDATFPQFDRLTRLAGALAPGGESAQQRLQEAVQETVEPNDVVIGLAVLSRENGRLWTQGELSSPERLEEILRESDPDQSGAQHLPGASPASLMLWSPIYREGGNGESLVWGQVAVLVDSERLFSEAGLHEPPEPYEVALTENAPSEPSNMRAVLVGSAGLASLNPVTTGIHLPGGDWTLAVAPSNGWIVSTEEILPVRGMTLIAAIATALLLLRIQALSDQRKLMEAALREKEAELAHAQTWMHEAMKAAAVDTNSSRPGRSFRNELTVVEGGEAPPPSE